MHFPKLKSKKLSKILKIVVLILVPLLVLAAIYFALDRSGYIKAFQLGMQVKQQQEQIDQDKIVLNNLKKIILLPGDDVTPTMAVINDIDALKKEQPGFFANAKNGDRVIVYPNLAIIYDSYANKIIQVGPINTQPQAQPESAESTAEQPAEESSSQQYIINSTF